MTSPTGGRATNTTAACGEFASPTATIREGQAGRLPLEAAAQNKEMPGRYLLSFDGPNIRARRFHFKQVRDKLSQGEDRPKGGTFQSAAFSRFPTNQKRKGGSAVKLTAQELEQMKSVDIGAVSADALADVSGMAFDRTLPREERLARFVKRAVNPYCFSVGGVGVKIEFAEGGPSLQETLTAFLIRQKSGL